MASYLDKLGLTLLWSRVKSKITEVVEESLETYITRFNEIQTQAQHAATEAEHYYNLTTEAINLIDPGVANTLTYAQAVAKHGRAITQIAIQLNATYNNTGTETTDEYTPGYIFVTVTKEEMDAILENGTAEDNKVYLVQE